MSDQLAELIDHAARRVGLNDYQLSGAIGLLPGKRIYSAKQVSRLRSGEVRHVPPDVLARLIEVLDLDAAEAYAAAGIWPPDLTPGLYRWVRSLTPEQLARLGGPAAQEVAAIRAGSSAAPAAGKQAHTGMRWSGGTRTTKPCQSVTRALLCLPRPAVARAWS